MKNNNKSRLHMATALHYTQVSYAFYLGCFFKHHMPLRTGLSGIMIKLGVRVFSQHVLFRGHSI